MHGLDVAVGELAAETLAELAFLFAEVLPGQALDGEPGERAVLCFSGARDGRLVLRAERGLLAVASANMLGQDVAPAAAVQRDALGELANIICGNLLPVLADRSGVLLLSSPLASPVAGLNGEDAFELSGLATLQTESGALELSLFLRRAMEATA